MSSKNIKKILIANRGEIAVRIIKTCKLMNIKSVLIYSPADKETIGVSLADEIVLLDESNDLSKTYLNQDLIVNIAKEYSCDAIHPGYGLLSENEHFAKLVTENNILFIGPKPENIKLMGDKISSKKALEGGSIPLVPGYHGDNQDEEYLFEQAKKIGLPVMIKATAGGGGKGMRVVFNEDDFPAELQAAKREAKKAFLNDKVLIEKFIESPRHIEVQVLSDEHGNHVHLFERECSIQRRHQKIIEESPSAFISEETREKITNVAVEIAEKIGYLGAGTVEFIMGADQSFYFLEMNTRLQVEHPVTEMVTGEDLVSWQIKVAEGQSISSLKNSIQLKGHSIELRIYAEDPENSFLPATGKIEFMSDPYKFSSGDVRFESGVESGSEISIFYDPMIAKLVVYGKNRNIVIEKLKILLSDFSILGVKTNLLYLNRILNQKNFELGDFDTNYTKTYEDILLKEEPESHEDIALMCAINEFGKKNTFLNVSNTNEESDHDFNNLWNQGVKL